jgi:Domain of unknown function (DUF4291)
MKTQPYLEQLAVWPESGRHILARFDEQSVYVYQAYRSEIADYAVKNQKFGGEFSFNRMSWIKPNFLWMMYRSGWASKEGQERILAIKLKRQFFDEVLRSVVASTHDPARFPSRESWQAAVANSDVRLQWDPDHDPTGRAVERRAVQIGLRGDTLRRYGQSELLAVEDITPFVIQQRVHVTGDMSGLVIPEERIYDPGVEAATVLNLSS